MKVVWFEDNDPRPTVDPLMALISIDEDIAYAALADEGVEHGVLLRKMVSPDTDIEKYYRIILDQDGADWTFICPSNYRGITNKKQRIEIFYDEGYKAIADFLNEIGYPPEIEVPKRYRR